MNQLWEDIRELYDADLAQRLQQCWDNLDLLDRALQEIQRRRARGEERTSDAEQFERAENLILVIGYRVERLMLDRELNTRPLTEPAT